MPIMVFKFVWTWIIDTPDATLKEFLYCRQILSMRENDSNAQTQNKHCQNIRWRVLYMEKQRKTNVSFSVSINTDDIYRTEVNWIFIRCSNLSPCLHNHLIHSISCKWKSLRRSLSADYLLHHIELIQFCYLPERLEFDFVMYECVSVTTYDTVFRMAKCWKIVSPSHRCTMSILCLNILLFWHVLNLILNWSPIPFFGMASLLRMELIIAIAYQWIARIYVNIRKERVWILRWTLFFSQSVCEMNVPAQFIPFLSVCNWWWQWCDSFQR